MPSVIDAPNTRAAQTRRSVFRPGPRNSPSTRTARPLRLDKAYSWESPIASHGMMHMVIHNAVEGDPYPIDTLMLFMANMAWNSSMNTAQTQDMLSARDEAGELPHSVLVVADAFDSETVRFADLVLPDTTYLERYDAISLLDRPISEPDTVADAIRHPVCTPDRDVRPWQEVLVDLAGRLGFPAFVDEQGAAALTTGIRISSFATSDRPASVFWPDFAARMAADHLTGAAESRSVAGLHRHKSFFAWHWPEHMQFNRGMNKAYLEKAAECGFIGSPAPIVMQIYSEPLQKFRLAGMGLYDGPQPPADIDRQRLAEYFDPLPLWYGPLETAALGDDAKGYDFHAITQRPMVMYHSWDSQNAWLRQILGQNFLYMNDRSAASLGLVDDDWVWVESHNGRIRCQLRTMQGVQANTVWTWNAIGKMSGAWGLTPNASEATHGFLLNHLISREPAEQRGRSVHHQFGSDHGPGGLVRPEGAESPRPPRARPASGQGWSVSTPGPTGHP